MSDIKRIIKIHSLTILLFFGMLIGIFGIITDYKIFLVALIGILAFKFSFDKFNALLIFLCLALPLISDYKVLFLIYYIFMIFTLRIILGNEFQIKTTNLYKYIILFFIIMILNTVLSINLNGSLRDLIIHFSGILLVFVIINSDIDKMKINSIFNSLILIAFLISIYGVYQYFTGVPMESGWVDIKQNPDLNVRVFATFENPNLFAEYLIMIFPIMFAQIIYVKGFMKKIAFLSFGFIMLIALLMTASRAGWLGFAFGLLIFVIILNFKLLLPMILLGIGMFPFMPASIINRIYTIGSLSDSSNYYRYELWKSVIAIVKDFWHTGIGIGYLTFRSVTPYYIKNMAPYHTHNTYLQILVEFGLIGLIFFLIFCFQIFKTGIENSRKTDDKFIRIFSIAMTASFSSIMLHGLAENIFFNPKIIIMFWLIIGLTIKLNLLSNESNLKKEFIEGEL